VYYKFLRRDERFRNMGNADDPARLYLVWWAMSVEDRRDWWLLRDENDMRQFADDLGTTAESARNMLEICLRNGLIHRAQGGAYVLDGTRDEHGRLRHWCPAIGAQYAERQNPSGEERRGEERNTPPPPSQTTPSPAPRGTAPAPRRRHRFLSQKTQEQPQETESERRARLIKQGEELARQEAVKKEAAGGS